MEYYIAVKKDKGLYLTGHDKIYCNGNSENSQQSTQNYGVHVKEIKT